MTLIRSDQRGAVIDWLHEQQAILKGSERGAVTRLLNRLMKRWGLDLNAPPVHRVEVKVTSVRGPLRGTDVQGEETER